MDNPATKLAALDKAARTADGYQAAVEARQALSIALVDAYRSGALVPRADMAEGVGWQPIETAPKMGNYLLYQPAHRAGRLELPARICTVDYSGSVRMATHWMAFPTPPLARHDASDGGDHG